MYIKVISFLQRFGLTLLEIVLGVTFLWFGLLLLFGTTPLLPFFQVAYPAISKTFLMFSVGTLEILLGLGILLPIIARPDMAKYIIFGALTLEQIYVTLLVATLLFSSGNVFAPSFPTITAFGYFTIHKLVAVVAALLVSAHRVNDVTA